MSRVLKQEIVKLWKQYGLKTQRLRELSRFMHEGDLFIWVRFRTQSWIKTRWRKFIESGLEHCNADSVEKKKCDADGGCNYWS